MPHWVRHPLHLKRMRWSAAHCASICTGLTGAQPRIPHAVFLYIAFRLQQHGCAPRSFSFLNSCVQVNGNPSPAPTEVHSAVDALLPRADTDPLNASCVNGAAAADRTGAQGPEAEKYCRTPRQQTALRNSASQFD